MSQLAYFNSITKTPHSTHTHTHTQGLPKGSSPHTSHHSTRAASQVLFGSAFAGCGFSARLATCLARLFCPPGNCSSLGAAFLPAWRRHGCAESGIFVAGRPSARLGVRPAFLDWLLRRWQNGRLPPEMGLGILTGPRPIGMA